MQQLHMNSFLKLLLLYQTTTFIVGPKYKKNTKVAYGDTKLDLARAEKVQSNMHHCNYFEFNLLLNRLPIQPKR